MNKALESFAKKLNLPAIIFTHGEADLWVKVEDWINPLLVESYKDNRNIERRTSKPYLNADQLNDVDMRTHVTGAVFEGRVINIDSNARVHNWRELDEDKNPLLAFPADGKVKVTLIQCPTWKDVEFIYDQMNSEDSRVTAGDRVDTARSRAGYAPQTVLTAKRMGTSVFAMVGCTKKEIDDAYADWKAELTLLDSLGVNDKFSAKDPMRKKYSVGICAAMLMTIRQNANKALAFWTAYAANDRSIPEVKLLLTNVELEQGSAGGGFNARMLLSASNNFTAYKSRT